MKTLENFQMFEVKEKVGMLQPDTWIVYSSYETKGDTVYKVMYNSQTEIRPTGIVNHSELSEAFDEDKIEIKGIKKYKKKDIEKGKK